MENWNGMVEMSQYHQESLREEADRERLAKQARRQPGMLRQALDSLLGTKSE